MPEQVRKMHSVVYIIERKLPKALNYYPTTFGVYFTKRDAEKEKQRIAALNQTNSYRVTGYWDQRPW